MITQIDFYILNAIQGIRCGFLDFIMPYITFLGSGGAIWIITSIILLFFRKTRKAGIAVIIALVLGWVLSTVLLKNIVARERPFNTAGTLLDEASLLIGAPSGRFSFPSGHALSSFSAAAVLLFYDRRIGLPALFLAALIAFSRLYLYVHFPTDILGGAVLSVVFAFAAIFIVNLIWRKKDERKLSDNT
ncbi:MAG: phosphatase PAP2 family protein [Clostridia bacterium]|nr:phosphatase PAP2 family protein [Clostridia bacterium]